MGAHWSSSSSSQAQGPQWPHNVAIPCCPKGTWHWLPQDGALDSGTSSVPAGWRPRQPGCVGLHTLAWSLWRPGLVPSLPGNGPGHRVGSHIPRGCPAALQGWEGRQDVSSRYSDPRSSSPFPSRRTRIPEIRVSRNGCQSQLLAY